MREAKTKLIGETSYTVNQLGPTRGVDLLHDLVRTLGPALAPIVSNIEAIAKVMDKDVEGLRFDFLGESVRALASGADKETTKRILKELASVTVVEGAGALSKCYEAHFARVGIAELFQWAGFALQTQYDDFFDVFGSVIKSSALPAVKTSEPA